MSIEVIADKTLLKLGIYILAKIYLKKRFLYFIKIIKDNKKRSKKAKTISNSEK